MEYKPVVQALIKRQKRASIACITTLQTNHLPLGESNRLAEFVLTKSNLRAQNPLIYHAEVPISLYGEDSLPAAGQKSKFSTEDKPMEDSQEKKKAKPKVEIHDLLKKQRHLESKSISTNQRYGKLLQHPHFSAIK